MDSVARIGIPVVAGLYLIGLIFFLRKIIVSKKKGREIDRRLIILAIAGGIAFVALVVPFVLAL